MDDTPFPIVGIGASAGGIDALQGFFHGMPDRQGLGIVIVTHLSPQRESILNEVVARFTHLAVHVAADGMKVQPDAVYVMPSDATLTIVHGCLHLEKPPQGHRERKPIDIFLSSLALDRGELAVGVILSGGESDGMLGIKVIKENGGLTLAQTGNGFGPHHADMPESAITAGFVDFTIPADQMGAKIAAFASHLSLVNGAAGSSADASAGRPVEQCLPEIFAILRNQIGHDFSGYKPKTFMRRVQRRMQMTQLLTAEAYTEWLRREPREVIALFRDLLINVTNFFRDAEAFESLAADVVPHLFEGRGTEDTVRIWVPGCATGEEVYSIGILLREHMETLSAPPRVQIFATDIDDRALAVARAARYPASLLDSVSEARRARFFVADGGSYVVAKDVRDLCVFSPHSVIRDPPFSRIDLISCRNLLIYFGMDIQAQVIPSFHYALRPNGYLFLGTAENVNQFEDLFEPVEKRKRIFRRGREAPGLRLPLILGTSRPGQLADLIPRQPPAGGTAMRRAVEAQVLERFAPAYVVVSRDGDVVYFSGRTGKYLENAAGLPTRELMTMVRKGLRLDLRAVFREAVETGRTVTRGGIAVEGDDGRVQMVHLTAEPVIDRAAGEPLFLILFDDDGPLLNRDKARSRSQAPDEGTVAHLERELRETRERLHLIIEEYEDALQELKSSNEELISFNQEMQRANEELEASKEERQSVNEELHTVIAELNAKVDALDRANSDLHNLFASTDIATIFLDRTLAIRSFTPPIGEIFNILPGDRGRPITDLSSRFELPDFAADIEGAFSRQQRIERHVEDAVAARHYLMRLAPYRDSYQQTEGVVVTFVNITGLQEAEARQRVLIAELQHRTRNLLAVVQSVAKQTIGKGGTLDSFFTRLEALGRLQNMVAGAAADHVDIADIVRQELHAVAGTSEPRVSMDGPPVPLRGDQVQTFALALHELATNAVKHGALKDGPGRLDVSWWTEGRPQGKFLLLDWQESQVPLAAGAAERVGYGRTLIERSLRFTLHAHTELNFGADGISCRIELPLASDRLHAGGAA